MPNEFWSVGAGDAESETRFIRHVLGLRRGDRILDAGCGDGRILLPLAKSGCRITGVDQNAEAYIAAEQRIDGRPSLDVTLLHADLVECRLPTNHFDAVISWFNSFGYHSDTINITLLRKLAACIVPGGRLLIHQLNAQRIAKSQAMHIRLGEAEISSKWVPSVKRLVGTFSSTHQYMFSLRLYSPSELCAHLAGLGVYLSQCFGDTDGTSYTENSPYTISVFERM